MSSTDTAPEKPAKKSDTVAMRILRDYWDAPKADGSDNRVHAGAIVEVSKDEAMSLIEGGMAERVKG
jgi:hypothetical protein